MGDRPKKTRRSRVQKRGSPPAAALKEACAMATSGQMDHPALFRLNSNNFSRSYPSPSGRLPTDVLRQSAPNSPMPAIARPVNIPARRRVATSPAGGSNSLGQPISPRTPEPQFHSHPNPTLHVAPLNRAPRSISSPPIASSPIASSPSSPKPQSPRTTNDSMFKGIVEWIKRDLETPESLAVQAARLEALDRDGASVYTFLTQ